MLPLMPSPTRKPTGNPLATYSILIRWFLLPNVAQMLWGFLVLVQNVSVSMVNAWNACISMKTFVLCRIHQKTRQRNSFINWADMQIWDDELQILCDKVSSTAGFLGTLCSEGSSRCYGGGPSPHFIACPAINDSHWFSWYHPNPHHPCPPPIYVFGCVCACLHV